VYSNHGRIGRIERQRSITQHNDFFNEIFSHFFTHICHISISDFGIQASLTIRRRERVEIQQYTGHTCRCDPSSRTLVYSRRYMYVRLKQKTCLLYIIIFVIFTTTTLHTVYCTYTTFLQIYLLFLFLFFFEYMYMYYAKHHLFSNLSISFLIYNYIYV